LKLPRVRVADASFLRDALESFINVCGSITGQKDAISLNLREVQRNMAGAGSHAEVKAAIAQFLASKNVPPTAAWLRDFMPSIRLSTPIVALQQTALFRLLASDLTTVVESGNQRNVFPTNVSSPEVKERKITGPITVQVLDVEDIGHSRWSQVENIEVQERGETTKGREIIRVVDDETNTDPNHDNNVSPSSGPHKLLVQDVKGTKAYAFELESIAGIDVQKTSIGAKLVLRDVLVARGVVMLEAKGVEVLGGKVDAWDKKWRAERKEGLKRKAKMSESAED
jgi:RecQ-mediated genome instability protein 1